MKKLLIICFLGFSFFGFSQDNSKIKQFLDENNQQVTKEIFDKKCGSFLHTCFYKEKKDSIIYNTFTMFKFGKLNKEQLIKVSEELNIDFKTKTKAIVITYKDTLYGRNSNKRNLQFYFQKPQTKSYKIKNKVDVKENEQIWFQYKYTFDKKIKKCIAQNDSYEYRFLYDDNKEEDYSPKYYKTSKVLLVLKKELFNNSYYTSAIIKPNVIILFIPV